MPAVVFADPEVANVGLTVADAERAGRDVEVVEVVDHEIGHLAGARSTGPTTRAGPAS